ncbi:MAG: ATP citrate lyase citrate-binding domain-containing protein, partial [Candidatus Curtissbacteria bacterium]
SGNPSREKVEKLTKIALSRSGLSGCLVAGAVANFTDIYETLSGFADGLKLTMPKVSYPIVVRRGGPRQQEAYKMLESLAKREGFDIHLFEPETPISVAAKKMVELSQEFKSQNSKGKSTIQK